MVSKKKKPDPPPESPTPEPAATSNQQPTNNKKRKTEPTEPSPLPEPVKRLKRSPRRRGGAATPPSSKEEGEVESETTTEAASVTASEEAGSQHDSDATSISSQDEDIQAKYSRRAIVNLQKLIDNVTAEIGLKKQEEEGQEEKVEDKCTEEDKVGKEDVKDKSKKSSPAKKETATGKKMAAVDNRPPKRLPHFDLKNVTNDDDEDTDPEVCSPPKLHKELAFLNQEMPILDTAPEMEPAIPMETNKMGGSSKKSFASGKKANRTDDTGDEDDEAPPLVMDEQASKTTAKKVPEDNDDDDSSMPHLPQHLQALSKQFEEELEAESKKKPESVEPVAESIKKTEKVEASVPIAVAAPVLPEKPELTTPVEAVSSSTNVTPSPSCGASVASVAMEAEEPMDMSSSSTSVSLADISNTNSKTLLALEAIKENINALNQVTAPTATSPVLKTPSITAATVTSPVLKTPLITTTMAASEMAPPPLIRKSNPSIAEIIRSTEIKKELTIIKREAPSDSPDDRPKSVLHHQHQQPHFLVQQRPDTTTKPLLAVVNQPASIRPFGLSTACLNTMVSQSGAPVAQTVAQTVVTTTTMSSMGPIPTNPCTIKGKSIFFLCKVTFFKQKLIFMPGLLR